MQALSRRPTGFLQCFDTVYLVIWLVKIVPEMTYNVLSGMLSFYTDDIKWLEQDTALSVIAARLAGARFTKNLRKIP